MAVVWDLRAREGMGVLGNAANMAPKILEVVLGL